MPKTIADREAQILEILQEVRSCRDMTTGSTDMRETLRLVGLRLNALLNTHLHETGGKLKP